VFAAVFDTNTIIIIPDRNVVDVHILSCDIKTVCNEGLEIQVVVLVSLIPSRINFSQQLSLWKL